MRKGFALVGFAAALALAPVLAQTKPKEKVEIEVPFVPTPQKVVDAMLKLAAVKPGDTVYDLGCGDGRIAITAVEKFKAKKGMGLDFNPERLKECQENLKKLPEDARKRLTFKQGDVLKLKPEDFKDVDVVTMYLLPSVNERLKPTLQKGLKPGARIVSHDFDMQDWKPDREETIKDDFSEHKIYLWVIKEKKD